MAKSRRKVADALEEGTEEVTEAVSVEAPAEVAEENPAPKKRPVPPFTTVTPKVSKSVNVIGFGALLQKGVSREVPTRVVEDLRRLGVIY